jgi:hypothetical protein
MTETPLTPSIFPVACLREAASAKAGVRGLKFWSLRFRSLELVCHLVRDSVLILRSLRFPQIPSSL